MLTKLACWHDQGKASGTVSIVQFNRLFAGVGKVTPNTCIVAPGRPDRSPTGIGTCARMAVLHARGAMRVGDLIVHESVISSRYTGASPAHPPWLADPAILPTIKGRAWITGLASEILDPTDLYPTGYPNDVFSAAPPRDTDEP